MQPEDDVEDPNACSLREPVIYFHCGYARKKAVELLKLKQVFYYLKFESCFVAFSVLRQVWIGFVRGGGKIKKNRPWHDILHDWNGRVNEFAARHGIKLWSERCVQQHWDLARCISSLGDQRWVKRLMQWEPDGRRRGGRPAHLWHTVLANFCRWSYDPEEAPSKGQQHASAEKEGPESPPIPDSPTSTSRT